METKRVGAAGAIFISRDTDCENEFLIPATIVNATVYRMLKHYVHQTKNPMAKLLKSETIVDLGAPLVASFSSSSPHKFVATVTKPDVTAPGIDVLAAFALDAPPGGFNGDLRSPVQYTFWNIHVLPPCRRKSSICQIFPS